MTGPVSPTKERIASKTPTGYQHDLKMRLTDRFFEWRDGVVSSSRFQRWAAAFPLTRWIAARQSRSLFDLCAGFVYSQILFACVSLNLFEILAEGPQTAEHLAPKLSLSLETTERLLRGAVALGLVSERGRASHQQPGMRYGLGMSGAALLGNPGVVGMIQHHRLLYGDLADPVALLRNASDQRAHNERSQETALTRFWPYARTNASPDQDAISPYTALMSVSQSLVVDDILEAYPFRSHHRVMDVGGGEGTFLIALARYAPHLHVTLFDLPAVANSAQKRFTEAQLTDRALAVGGNAALDILPEGADLITLIRVLHDHDDDRAAAVLAAIFKALPPGGNLLLAEPMSGIKGAEPMGDAYFGFYLLAMGSGRPRRPQEIVQFLHQAGFENIQVRKTRRPMLISAISASKPSAT